MKKIIVAGSMAAAAFATPALAQDEKATDFYVGAIGGYDSVRISDGTDSGSKDGVVYGVIAGATTRVGETAVLGLEAELSDSSVSESATDIFVTGDSAKLSAGRDIALSALAGYRLSTGSLIFVKGGYTNERVKLTYDDGTGPVSGSDNLEGFRLGGGVQIELQPNIKVRVEYRYSDYGDYKFQGVNTGISATRHQVIAGLIGSF